MKNHRPVFITIFIDISVMSWWSVLLVDDPEETTDLPRVDRYIVRVCHNKCQDKEFLRVPKE
jgi:hypothetical protein